MKELFYIKGDPNNPEGVKKALLKKYPNAINRCNCLFMCEDDLFYVDKNEYIVGANIESDLGKVIKIFGTEIFPKKKQKFEEKTMYLPIYKVITTGSICLTPNLYNTIDEAMNSSIDIIGYKEVKVKIIKK